jgi:hypothetical protein
LIRSLLCALAAMVCAAPASGQVAPVTVFRGATLIDGTGAAPRADMAVTVEGERIVRITRGRAAAGRRDFFLSKSRGSRSYG